MPATKADNRGRRSRVIFIALCLPGLLECARSRRVPPQQKDAADGPGGLAPDAGMRRSSWPEAWSLIQLLATPERYDGATVQATGFLVMDWPKSGMLYLSKADYDEGLTNAVGISLEPCAPVLFGAATPPEALKRAPRADGERPFPPSQELSLHYVVVRGRFEHTKGSAFPGEICSVTRLESTRLRTADAGTR